MRRVWLVVCLLGFCLPLLASTGGAFALNCTDPDLMGLVWQNGEINIDIGMGIVSSTLYIVNPSSPCECLQGWECLVTFPSNLLFVGVTYMGQAINVAQAPEFAVGIASPLYAGPDHLIAVAELDFFVLNTDPAEVLLSPNTTPSIPGEMIYVDGHDVGNFIVVNPISGDHSTPVAQINGTALHWCELGYDFTVGIASRGDNDNLAGVSPSATDGYDYGIDLPEDPVNSHVWFPHPEWSAPVGDDFAYDIKATYDPLTEVGMWSFIVEVENSTSGSMAIDVDFDPSFASGDGIGLELYDHTAGTTSNLFPSLQYSYTIPAGTTDTRDFDLSIGTETITYDLSVGLDAQLGGLSDTGNLAATLIGATDGYDAGIDIPHPPSPPSYYLTACFPHPGWPLGDCYRVDVREPFDPLAELKTWTFDVETDQSGTVALSFDPSFTAGSGWGLMLRDHQSGTVHDLFPGLTFSYFANNDTRTFDLLIGNQAAEGFTLLVDAFAGGYSDEDNLAAIQAGATDDYDPGIDIPEPGPPPADYVAAHFPHVDWPLGTRYHTDVRELYDPVNELKTWPLTVETDQSGSVMLTFEPSFTAMDNIGLRLRDNALGLIVNLFPNLQYSYAPGAPGTPRDFDILIGPVQEPPPLQPTEREVASGWSLIGFPLVPPPGQDTLDDVILDDVTGLAYLYRYLGTAGYELAAASDPVVQGQGMWIVTDQAFTWSMPGDPDEDGIPVPLRNGWTLVGYPLWFPGSVDGVKVDYNSVRYDFWDAVTLGIVSSSVFDYDPGLDEYVAVTDLSTWHGYWVAGLHNGVSLWFDYPNFFRSLLGSDRPDDSGIPADKKWRVAIDMDDGLGRSAEVTFGVHPEASAGFDALYDVPVPPLSPTGTRSQFNFEHPEWEVSTGSGFLTDIVSLEEAESHVWPATIWRAEPGPVTLTWDSTEWLPGQDFQIYLPDHNRVVVRSMRDQSQVVINAGSEPRAIHFRTPDHLSDVVESEITAYRIDVHPNPFNPSTKIGFDLPRAARAEIRIYDVRGRMIRRLPAGTLQVGTHSVTWHGRDESGRNVASGVFFAVLYADDRNVGQIKKMILVR